MVDQDDDQQEGVSSVSCMRPALPSLNLKSRLNAKAHLNSRIPTLPPLGEHLKIVGHKQLYYLEMKLFVEIVLRLS